MTRTPLADLAEITAPAGGDLLYALTNPSGTPGDKKLTLANLAIAAAGLVNMPRARELLTIADDAVGTITPTDNGGALMMIANHNTVSPQLNRSAIIGYDVSTTPNAQKSLDLAATSDVEVTTGVLSGMTGADGKVTVSAHSDGTVYIENRLGGSVKYQISFLGMR